MNDDDPVMTRFGECFITLPMQDVFIYIYISQKKSLKNRNNQTKTKWENCMKKFKKIWSKWII